MREIKDTKESCRVLFRVEGDSLVATVVGEVDHHNSKKIRGQIDERTALIRPRELVLDLSRVGFMDSSGLGLILGRFSTASDLGITFRVCDPTEQTRKILDLAGMERIVRITYSKKEKREEQAV